MPLNNHTKRFSLVLAPDDQQAVNKQATESADASGYTGGVLAAKKAGFMSHDEQGASIPGGLQQGVAFISLPPCSRASRMEQHTLVWVVPQQESFNRCNT